MALMDAAALRRLADALDCLAEITAKTGVALCAYGTDHIDVDGSTLALQSAPDGDAIRYVVDLSPN